MRQQPWLRLSSGCTVFNVIGNCGADSTPWKGVFPMETEDTDQGRFEDRFHGALLELSDCEDAGSEAMEEVVLEPPEHTAEAVLAGEAMRAEAAEEAADDPLLLSAPTPALPVLMTIERKLDALVGTLTAWPCDLSRGREGA